MNELFHHGTPHVGDIPHSGRYEWGSGERPNQHGTESVTNAVSRLKRDGYSEKEIAEKLGFSSTTELRKKISTESSAERAAQIHRVRTLREHGNTPAKIAELMGVPTRTVYNWLSDEEALDNATKKERIADILQKAVDEKGYVDVGSGTEYMLNTTDNTLQNSLKILEENGYSVLTVKTPNVTDPSKHTNIKVLCKPGTEWGYIQNHQELIQPFTDFSTDGGLSFRSTQYPESISSDRVAIRYAEDGGKDMDGVMLIRRGVDDLSLGNSNYAQVRIAVDGTHYLKGMALYSDDLPDGVDILFNTNKDSTVPKMDVLKKLKDNPDLPFGAVIKANGQSYYEDPNGKYVKNGSTFEKKDIFGDEKRYSLSAINKLKEEGDWDEYSRNLSSQFLSKQNITLINKQLTLTYDEKKDEFDKICQMTQPEIKKKMLLEFASDCDASATDLKATALPGQTTKVILPLTKIKDDEIYAPGYDNGTKVALVRFPHAGLFEIPVLTVNNNNSDAKKILGTTPIDAVGITSKVASKLSGADFDGDTVVVIPMSDKVHIASMDTLKGLKDFDPSRAYPKYEGMPIMTDRQKGLEMGMISNLITDMTLQGASVPELERAVKHSMVVIDAQKHELNWKLSEEQNGIAALRKEYQGKAGGGAATLISKASSEARVPERKEFNPNMDIDPKTGEINWRTTNREYQAPVKVTEKDPVSGKQVPVYTTNQYGKQVPVYKTDENGEVVYKTKEPQSKISKMEYAFEQGGDAYTLSSGTKKESAYADYANRVHGLANQARLEYLNTKSTTQNKSAKQAYAKEIESLTAKLELAVLNSPKERRAQLIASNKVKNATKYTNYTPEELKKLRQQSLAQARAEVGANKKDVQIQISDREWEAIQNGAFSSSFLQRVLSNTNTDELKQRALPRNNSELSSSQINLIKSRANSGFTISEIAESLGVSSSTVSKYLKE